jgi:hypothetical protein
VSLLAGRLDRVQREELLVPDLIPAPSPTGASAADLDGWLLRPSRCRVVEAVVRRLVPYLIEATVIPTALFYALLVVGGMPWALGGALAWNLACTCRRLTMRRPVPGLLVLATSGLVVRTIVYAAGRDEFVYFVQPIARASLTGGLFAVSVVVGRPLIARFANDFCPLAPHVTARSGVGRLFRRLTMLWAAVNVIVAGSGLVLLLTLPVAAFVVTAAVAAWTVTAAAVVVTVADSVATARREGLVTAMSADGRLYADSLPPAKLGRPTPVPV